MLENSLEMSRSANRKLYPLQDWQMTSNHAPSVSNGYQLQKVCCSMRFQLLAAAFKIIITLATAVPISISRPANRYRSWVWDPFGGEQLGLSFPWSLTPNRNDGRAEGGDDPVLAAACPCLCSSKLGGPSKYAHPP